MSKDNNAIHCPICDGVETWMGFHGSDVDHSDPSMGHYANERGEVCFLDPVPRMLNGKTLHGDRKITIADGVMYLRQYKAQSFKPEGILPINYCPICGKKLRKELLTEKNFWTSTAGPLWSIEPRPIKDLLKS